MSLTKKTVIKGDTVTLSYQLKEDGSPKDISGMSFKLAVKENLTDPACRIGPLTGTVQEAASGKFSFALTATETDQTPFSGVYEIAMYDGSGNRLVVTPPRGVPFSLLEDIIG